MIPIKQIEYHVADACNLACEFCTHYSNFKGPANILSPEEIELEWEAWSQRIVPSRVHLIGGEPLLNPNIVDIVRLAFRTWPLSTIYLYSNGLLLKNHPGLRGALKGGRYALGLHYCDDRDKETELFVRNFFLDTGVEVDVVDGAEGWLQFYKFDQDGNPVPYTDNNHRSSWENCVAAQQKCLVLRNGKLWKCPQVAFADRAGIAHWFDGYSPCSIDDDIQAWLSLEDENCCSKCPAQQQFTEHGAAYMRPRLPIVEIKRAATALQSK